MSAHGQAHSLASFYSSYNAEISEFTAKVEELQSSLIESLAAQNYSDLAHLETEIIQVKQDIDESQSMQVCKENMVNLELEAELIRDAENHRIRQEQIGDAKRIKEEIKEEYVNMVEEMKQEIQRLKLENENTKTDRNQLDDKDLELFQILRPEEHLASFNDYHLCYSLNTEYSRQILQKLKKFRLPEIRRIWLEYIDYWDTSYINEFLVNSFPTTLPLFCFGWYADNTIDINPFIDSLKLCLPKVTREIVINDFCIQSTHLETIIKSSKNVKRLIIRDSKIESSPDLNFSSSAETSEKSRIEYLSFAYSGREDNSDWGQFPNKLVNIIAAIADNDLRDSLKTLNICQSGLEEVVVRGMLDDHGLEQIRVVDEENIYTKE